MEEGGEASQPTMAAPVQRSMAATMEVPALQLQESSSMEKVGGGDGPDDHLSAR